jgi:hypothetical protein
MKKVTNFNCMELTKGTELQNPSTGEWIIVDSDYKDLQGGYDCIFVEFDEDGNQTEIGRNLLNSSELIGFEIV